MTFPRLLKRLRWEWGWLRCLALGHKLWLGPWNRLERGWFRDVACRRCALTAQDLTTACPCNIASQPCLWPDCPPLRA